MVPDQSDSIKNQDFIKYAIPGVEPGDEIEFRCEYEVRGDLTSKMYGNVFLVNYLPVVKSRYSIKVPYPYAVFYKCYNGFKNPTTYTSGSKITCTFLLDSISVINDLLYASVYNEIPYFYYSIEYDKTLAEAIHWKDLFNKFNQYTSLPPYMVEYDASCNQWIRKNLKHFKEMDKFQQFKEVYSRITESYDNISVAENINPLIQPVISRMDGAYLYRACYPYVKLLKYLDIEFFTGFARNKYYGKIDENFIRKDEITDIFLMYYDKDSNMNMVYPNDKYHKYHLNEIPVYLYGTDAYMINMSYLADHKPMNELYKADHDSDLIIRKVQIRKGNEKSNYYQRIRNIGIDLNSDVASYQSTTNFSGSSSTANRFFFQEIFHDKEKYKAFLANVHDNRDIFKVDSIYLKYEQSKSPFKYSFFTTGTLKNFFNHINDSTIIISVEDILNNNIIQYNKQYRNLDLVLPYKFTDIQDLIIEFDRPVKIVNEEALEKELENGIGSYKFQLMLMGNNKVRLTSTYIIKQDNISKTMLNQLDALNNAAGEMGNSKVIVGL